LTNSTTTKSEIDAEYADRVANHIPTPEAVITPMFGKSELLLTAPYVSQIERFASFMMQTSAIGGTPKVNVMIVDSGRDAKCYYSRTKAYTDVQGTPVATIAVRTLWFALSERELVAKILHEVAHGINAVAGLNAVDGKVDVAANGKHTDMFLSSAQRFFTKKSFHDEKSVKASKKLVTSDVRTLKAKFEFTDATDARIAEFGWNQDLFNVRRVADDDKTRKSAKTVSVGCLTHHWNVEAGERSGYTARIKADDVAPTCSNVEHFAKLAAYYAGVGAGNAKQAQSTIENVSAHIEGVYVIDPSTK